MIRMIGRSKTLAFRMPLPAWRRLDAQAAREGRSASGLARQWVMAQIDRLPPDYGGLDADRESGAEEPADEFE
jgi:predicted DNA-binding protein